MGKNLGVTLEVAGSILLTILSAPSHHGSAL